MGEIKRLMQGNEESEQRLFRIGENQERKVIMDAEALLRQAFGQNADAGIELLFKYYYSLLCNHAVRYVSSKAIAEDIVSDIYYEFHAQKLYLSINTSYRAYLFTCVRNRAFDYVRTEMSRSTSLEATDFLSIPNAQQPDSITQFEDLYHDVENVINAMPIKRRQIYIMHRFDGKKYQEIADELHLSVKTIEAHLYQAMRQIRTNLQDKWLLILLCLLETLLR